MVEASRRHGPFDTRWASAGQERFEAAVRAPLSEAEIAEALDWDGFSNRYFRDRRRHDSEALLAYASYNQRRQWQTKPTRPRRH